MERISLSKKLAREVERKISSGPAQDIARSPNSPRQIASQGRNPRRLGLNKLRGLVGFGEFILGFAKQFLSCVVGSKPRRED